MNYNERSRTNYFKVKNQEALEKFADTIGAELNWEGDRVAMYMQEGIPPTVEDEETGDDVEVDFFTEVCKFLADGEILILQGSGYEGMRALTGWATACDNTGKLVQVNIDDIYAKAARAFCVKEEDITQATQ